MSTTISSQPATNLGYFEPLPFDFIDLATINLSFFEALPFYQTLDSFELFPKLPGELQVMIWQAAAADLPVRTCSIRQSPGQARPNIANPKYSIGFQERWTTRFSPNRQTPVLLSICQDSRKFCKSVTSYSSAALMTVPFGSTSKKTSWTSSGSSSSSSRAAHQPSITSLPTRNRFEQIVLKWNGLMNTSLLSDTASVLPQLVASDLSEASRRSQRSP